MNRYQQQITGHGEDFRVADRLEILDLVWRFTMAIDIGDRDMFESCFTDPMLWDLSNNPVPFTGGPADSVATQMRRADFVATAFGAGASEPSREAFTQHCVNNPIITFTGDGTATVLAHLRNPFHTKVADDSGELRANDRTLGGLYHIDTARDADRWRMSALRLSVYAYDPQIMAARRST